MYCLSTRRLAWGDDTTWTRGEPNDPPSLTLQTTTLHERVPIFGKPVPDQSDYECLFSFITAFLVGRVVRDSFRDQVLTFTVDCALIILIVEYKRFIFGFNNETWTPENFFNEKVISYSSAGRIIIDVSKSLGSKGIWSRDVFLPHKFRSTCNKHPHSEGETAIDCCEKSVWALTRQWNWSV